MAWLALASLSLLWGVAATAQSMQGASVLSTENLTRGFRLNGHFTIMAQDPNDPQVAYIGTRDGYIYRTYDGGVSWSEILLDVEMTPIPRALREGISVGPLNLRGLTGARWPDTGSRVFVASDAFRPFRPFNLTGVPNLDFFDSNASSFGPNRLLATRSAGPINNLLNAPPMLQGAPPPVQLSFDRTRLFRSEGFRRRLGSNDAPIFINWITVAPHDSRIIIAATSEGLFESRDRGEAWVRTFDTQDEQRRVVNYVYVAPTSRRRFLCTERGLLISDNDGVSYRATRSDLPARFPCYWIAEDPTAPGTIWLGNVLGVSRAQDNGDTFKIMYLKRIPGLQDVSRIIWAPDNPRRLVAMSDEALFVSDDGGINYEVRGWLTFSGQTLISVRFGVNADHLIAATEQDLWQSFDGGQTWRIIAYGKVNWRLRQVLNDPDTGELIVLSQGELLRLTQRALASYNPRKVRALELQIEAEPTLTDTLRVALQVNNAWRADLNDIRQRARASQWMPLLQVEFWAGRAQAELFTSNREIDAEFDPNNADAYPRSTSGEVTNLSLLLNATWDLPSLVFHADELPQGRVFDNNEARARRLHDVIISIYTERRRLQLEAAVEERPDPRRSALRRLRLEELTVQLNLLTNGMFAVASDGAGPQ